MNLFVFCSWTRQHLMLFMRCGLVSLYIFHFELILLEFGWPGLNCNLGDVSGALCATIWTFPYVCWKHLSWYILWLQLFFLRSLFSDRLTQVLFPPLLSWINKLPPYSLNAVSYSLLLLKSICFSQPSFKVIQLFLLPIAHSDPPLH